MSFRDIQLRKRLGKLSPLCPDNLENGAVQLATKDGPLVEQVWCLCAPLDATQEAEGLGRAKQGRAGPEAGNFRSSSMGGKLLPDLAWNNVLSLCLFVSLLPLVKLCQNH